MRVAVVGAGLSGLGAARSLAAHGHEVVVFEKSRGLGGRIASRRVDETVVDHGAPAIDAPAGSALAGLIAELGAEDAVAVGAGQTGAATPDAPMAAPHGFPGGLTQLAKRMAEAPGVEIVRSVRIAVIRRVAAGLELGDEQGNGRGRFDAVIVSAPAPQAADLLERSPEPPARVSALRALGYHPAVMVVVGARLPGEPAWFLRRPESGPVAVVTVETHKGRPARDGVVPLVARLTPEASAAALDAMSDEEVLALALPALAEVVGADPDPAWTQVKRWRFSTVAERAAFDELNPPGTRVVLCGDTVSPPGMAAVYESGLAAAERVMALEPVSA